jgi:hydrogenase expression/formation protein HypC
MMETKKLKFWEFECWTWFTVSAVFAVKKGVFMCVAIPAQVKSIHGTLAEVEVGGVSRQISLQLTPQAQRGDYVLVHAGFAIHVIDEQEARETLRLFEELTHEVHR